MEHVYHWRRPDLRGTVLYPLNLLASVHPDLYDTEVKKYVGREDLLTFRVPYLDVLWNDVLHTSTVHPSTIRLALEECGFGPEDLRPGFGRFFRIPIEHLEGMPMVWYAADDATGPRHSFRPFDPDRYHELDAVGPEYLVYLRECRVSGTQPLLYWTVPHVLVAEAIDTDGLEVLDWRDPPRPTT